MSVVVFSEVLLPLHWYRSGREGVDPAAFEETSGTEGREEICTRRIFFT